MAKFQLFKDLRYRRHGVSSFSDIHSSRRPSKEKRDFIDSFWTCRLTLRWGLMYLTKIENQAYCVTWTLTSHAEPYILCTNILFFAAIVLTIYSLFLSSLSCVVSQCRDLFFPHTSELTLLEPFSHPTPPTPPRTPFSFLSVAALCSPALASLHSASRLLSAFFCLFVCVCLFLLVLSRTFSLSLVSPLLQQAHPSLYYFSYFVTFLFSCW